MRFIVYAGGALRGCKIDWDVDIAIDDDVRQALHPHESNLLRGGRLRRPFRAKARTADRRSASVCPAVRGEVVTHVAGARVFAYPDDSVFLVEAL